MERAHEREEKSSAEGHKENAEQSGGASARQFENSDALALADSIGENAATVLRIEMMKGIENCAEAVKGSGHMVGIDGLVAKCDQASGGGLQATKAAMVWANVREADGDSLMRGEKLNQPAPWAAGTGTQVDAAISSSAIHGRAKQWSDALVIQRAIENDLQTIGDGITKGLREPGLFVDFEKLYSPHEDVR